MSGINFQIYESGITIPFIPKIKSDSIGFYEDLMEF